MRVFCGWFIGMFMFTGVFGQPQSSNCPTAGDDFNTFLKLTGHTLTAPTRWNSTDWLTAGGVVAGTGIAYTLDDDGYRLMQRNQSSFNDGLHDIGKQYGSGITGVAAIGGFYLAGWAFDNTWMRETGLIMASALTTSALAQTTFKFLVGRARPYTGLSHTTFRPFNTKADFASFPSGHTITAFTISTVLSERIKNTWASIGLYSLATIAGASRMYSRDHWFSDVVFGGALSTFVARSVVRYYESGMNEEDASFRILPQMNGVTVVWRF